ncbi:MULTISPECIES: hypothetical protein [unclassified Rhizobium]|uniref:hypothetical protein n=1 Tax=unclassified Rhizobium TaxID=2613769 RepID=UPI001ADC9851|nr:MULTISPECIES: hypothetical protein [unclassified Rhizobium]MBO9127691.1 hypothetical protein [Rhizobium sp. 16-488-2b]MBO9178153.1 hypothetical protein [Rhizobium sp. 16-488-2a]
MSPQAIAAEQSQRSDNEKKKLNDSLRTALNGLSAAIRKKARGSTVLLEQYDGQGKLFEALILFAVRNELKDRNVKVGVRPQQKDKPERFLLRGAPGRLKPKRAPTEPSYFTLAAESGKTFEMHSSVEWPDHHVGASLGHELDISIAAERDIDMLREWTAKSQKLPRPVFALEAKFRSRGPDKSLGRELTGLAYGLHAGRLLLVSSKEPDDSVKAQVSKIVDLGNKVRTQASCLTFFHGENYPDDGIFRDIAKIIADDLNTKVSFVERILG